MKIHSTQLKTILAVTALWISSSLGFADEGFVPLFNGKNLDGWQGLNGDTSSFYVKDGLLICKGDGRKMIFSNKQYANFVLRVDVKLDPGGNNGVGIRTKLSRRPDLEGMEIQIIDNPYYSRGIPKPNKEPKDWTKLKDYQYYGSIYGVAPAKLGHLKSAGDWNEEEIVCDGRRVKITLNGTVIVDADLDKVTPVDGEKHPGLQNALGYIALCAHGDYGAQVYFRNMRIKELK